MGCRCAIEICRNTSSKTRLRDKSIKFHSFPKVYELRKKWISACRRTSDWIPDNSSYICSEHFLPADFERDLKAELLKLPPKRILKPEAVPSINLINTQTKTEKTVLQKLKIQDFTKENKENSFIDSNNSLDGLISSCLGVPLFPSSEHEIFEIDKIHRENTRSQSESVSVKSEENIQSKFLIDQDNNLRYIDSADFGQNKNIFKLEELCRLCGSYSNRMKNIFDNSDCNYCELIREFFPAIVISKNDILPQCVCSRCESSLIAWFKFSKTCNIVNERYKSILSLLHPKEIIDKSDVASFSNPNNMQNSYEMKEEVTNLKDVDDLDFTNVSDMREIEIVEVSPEVIEIGSAEFIPQNEKLETETAGSYLMEEDINTTSDVEAETEDDFDEETESSSGPLQSAKDRKVTSIRRKRKGRLSSLCLKRMCHICGKIFKYPESLRRHLKTVHSDERPFKCHLCTSSFNRNHNLTIHIKVVHQRQRVYVKKNIPRLCDYCGKVLLSVRSLEEHISSIHTKNALYECDRCHSTFFRKWSYDKHKTSNECDGPNSKISKSNEEFLKYCEFCGLEFKKEHFYIKHKFKHMNSFTCSICPLKFVEGTALKEHINSDHPELTPFECKVCHKKFKNKSLLNCHQVIHTGEKRYQCETCSLKFLKKKYLSTHILTHTGERPFVCSICHKGFKQSGDMRKHKATHMRGHRVI